MAATAKEPRLGPSGVNRGNAGKGRRKGSVNKVNAALKDMILQALHNKGGVVYLEAQAEENPTAFMTLVGKVLPLTVSGPDGQPVQIQQVGWNVRDT